MSKAPASSSISDQWGQFTGIPNEFIEQATRLSNQARWLFVLLRFYTGQRSGVAFPSYDTLHTVTGWNRTTISKAIQELAKQGWLIKKKAFGGVNHYTLRRPNSTEDELLEISNSPNQGLLENTRTYSKQQLHQKSSPETSIVLPVDGIKTELIKTEHLGVVTPKTPPVNNLVNSIINGARLDGETVPANENLPEENRADQEHHVASSGMLEKGSDGLKRRARPVDPFWQIFATAFLATYDLTAPAVSAGFVQLAKLRKQQDGTLTEAKWRRAVENYFATPQGNHTLADLCVRFASFYKHPLDRFGKPVEATAADQDDSDPTGLRRLARQLAAPYGIL